MTEIVVNVEEPMEIGTVHIGEIYMDYGPIRTAIKIIKEVTIDDYLDYVEKHNLIRYVKRSIHNKKFYLVEVLD